MNTLLMKYFRWIVEEFIGESLGVIGKTSTQLLLVNLEDAKDETRLSEYKT